MSFDDFAFFYVFSIDVIRLCNFLVECHFLMIWKVNQCHLIVSSNFAQKKKKHFFYYFPFEIKCHLLEMLVISNGKGQIVFVIKGFFK